MSVRDYIPALPKTRPRVWDLAKGALALALVLAVTYLYREIYFIWSIPPRLLTLVAVAGLVVFITRIPWAAAAFYLAGAASLLWSLAPGHTLVNTLWEALYLALLAAARWLPAYLALNAAFLLVGLEQSLLLDSFGLTQYFSGSIHYVAGAQGLLFLPVCLALALRSTRGVTKTIYLLAGGFALFVVLNSGSRAVYLPLLIILPFLLWRLWQDRVTKTQLVQVVVCPLLIAAAMNIALPGNPIVRAAGLRVAATASSVVEGDVSRESPVSSQMVGGVEDGIRSRLKMWQQAAHIGLSEPLGTGSGTYREVIHSYQRFSSVGFSSAHNVFLEVFATGGWVRLLLLLTLLLPAWVRGWTRDRWHYALGSVALWLTLSFDVTAQMPAVMALAFASLGPLYDVPRASTRLLTFPHLLLSSIVLVVAVAVSFWWYLPCDGLKCVNSRYMGFRPYVRPLLGEVDGATRLTIAEEAVRQNSSSLWAWQELFEATENDEQKLATAREIAIRFPKADPDVYVQWAELALDLGELRQAREAISVGLTHFPPELRPAGVPISSRSDEHAAWLDRAREIQSITEPLQ